MRLSDEGARRAEELLGDAAAAGLRLSERGGRLVVRGPAGADRALVEALVARKEELLPLLVTPTELEADLYEERAAIAELDGGLSRADAERLAWGELLDRRERAFRDRRGP